MTFQRNVAQRGDALALLRSLPDCCTPLVHSDPQYRSNLDRLAYGNEGARQSARCRLPQMSDEYIDAVCHEAPRVLRPRGYFGLWADTFRVLEGFHLPLADVFECVDLIAWDNQRPGNGYRARRRGSYLIILQKPPKRAKGTWRRKPSIPDRWIERIDRPRSHLRISSLSG
jgi:site-specific DNA-methyltransferase (adenine-specific)